MARLRESESSKKNYLKTGAEYIASMRDERVVYCGGEVIEDVTKHPATAGGIEIIGRLYDQQHQPAYEDVLTYTRDDGARTTMAFKPPRTTADLRERSRAIEHIARETFGFFGRGIDMIPMAHVGMVAEYPAFKRMAPEFADNIFSYMQYAEENNLHLAETISEPQGFRARTTGTSPDTEMPDRAVTRITRESSKGIWISGIKAVGTAAPQAHEVVVGRPFPSPREDECFWAIAAANAPGVRMFSREILANPDASPETHPITVRGEEQECLVAFDDVFIPRERIFSLRCKEAHEPRFFLRFARLEHWYTLTRMVVKAELYVGLVQLVCDVLNITESQVVRQRVAEVIQYAQILRGLALASEENAEITEGDVAMPDANLVTAARLYALERLPWILHIIQDLCGQGLMVRFSDKDLEAPCAFGKNLAWFLDMPHVPAREKNLVMNLVWDVTSSATASRVSLFEQANAQSAPFLKERLYRDYDGDDLANRCRAFIGLDPVNKQETVETFFRSNATTR